VRRLAPDVVLGVGGYASGPVVLMAKLRGIPTGICEQNSIPGLTNKILGRLVRGVFLAFDDTRQFFAAKRIVMTGNPVRRGLVAKLQGEAPPADGKLHVLVCGGSQGAVAVNQLASAALCALAAAHPLAIVHQTGERDRDATAAVYAAAGVAADVVPFISDMASAYARADVVIGRAGATTVAELAIAGKPAILIPYPSAADNHQEKNAREMSDRGAALMLHQADTTAASLADALRPLIADATVRAKMGAAMRALGKPGAAAAIVEWCAAQTR
jgi:UDP-N-acetylglucosamine--N-acetylmuramyl-(pentapeptide) pyrophosphoryl-undecaprenol N-acetylglucosamine transferase